MKKLPAPCLAALLLGLAGCETTPTATAPHPPAPTVDLSKLDQMPQARIRVAPIYPLELKKQGATGQVVVEFIIDPEGNVVNPVVVRSTHPDFEVSALSAILQWKFTPGIKDGRAVNTRLQQQISFDMGGVR